MKLNWSLCGAAALTVFAMPAAAAQVILSPGSVIGNTGSYGNLQTAANIFDQQTEPVYDTTPGVYHYWINTENGPQNAYITVDLGANYSIASFDLFNTHNAFYGDRGTGNFSIIAGNSVALDGSNGFTLTGPTTTIAVGTLAAAPINDPIAAQSFTSLSSSTFRYLQFLPTSVASVNTPCCSANEYGLAELRVFAGAPTVGGVPEPASWAMMLAGFGIVGGVMRRRSGTVSVAA